MHINNHVTMNSYYITPPAHTHTHACDLEYTTSCCIVHMSCISKPTPYILFKPVCFDTCIVKHLLFSLSNILFYTFNDH